MTTRRSTQRLALVACSLLCVAALVSACAGRQPAAQTPRATPKVLTVQEIVRLAEMGNATTTITGEIQESGTVYRLTDTQAAKLRASLPATLLSFMQLTYVHAVEVNPDLGKSNDKWTQVEGYWYGGTPFGWPKEWVIGAPGLGDRLRGR